MARDLPAGLDTQSLGKILDAAIAEDVGKGDITSQAVIPAGTQFSGVLAAREDLVIAGLPIAEAVFARFTADARWSSKLADGDRAAAGAELAHVGGPAVELLAAERTAINILQHLSGIATLTRRFADAIEGTGAVLLDTRKTIPGLRALAKYATRMGGATNHRMRLDDGVLIKDNHVAVSGGVGAAVKAARDAGLSDIEVECDTEAQVAEALEAGADSILLDNMDVGQQRRCVELVAGRCPLEASGDVSLETIRAIAETGVNFISVGRLTHSAAAVNMGLDWSAD